MSNEVVMRNIVYINTFQNYEQYDKFHDMINGVDCSKLYREEIVDDSRPVWGKFMMIYRKVTQPLSCRSTMLSEILVR
jgi:hypothetical protein